MRRTVLAVLVLVPGAVPAFAQDRPRRPPVQVPRLPPPIDLRIPKGPPNGYHDPSKFPADMQELARLGNQFAFIRHAAVRRFQEIDHEYHSVRPSKHFDRWEWLSAQRDALQWLDQAARDVCELEAAFKSAHAACPNVMKAVYSGHGVDMAKFPELRIKYRYSWYYTTQAHRWPWEQKTPVRDPATGALVYEKGLHHKIRDAICRRTGLSTYQLLMGLAYVDLIATDLLPAHTRQFLTIPLGLMHSLPNGMP